MVKYQDNDVIGLICDGMTILVIDEHGQYRAIKVCEDEYDLLKEVMRQPALLERPDIRVLYVMPEPGEVLIDNYESHELEIMHVSVLEYNELKRMGYVRSTGSVLLTYMKSLMRIILGR